MKTLVTIILAASMLLALQSARAESNMIWRVSVKVLLESDGAYPQAAPGQPGPDRAATKKDYFDSFEEGSRILAHTGQKVRLDLVEVVELDKLSIWNWINADCGDVLRWLNNAATANPRVYGFRTDAINVYVVRCTGRGGGGGLYPAGANVSENQKGDIIIRRPANAGGLTHEIGHHFGLGHTHGGTDESLEDCGDASFWFDPGNDGISETLPDHECWSLEQLTRRSYGVTYSSLSFFPAWMRARVDDTYGNLMSYHWNRDDAARLADQNNIPRLLTAQMIVARNHAAASRRSELRFEFRRDVELPVSERFDADELEDRQCELIDELQGRWTAVRGFRDWITSIELRPDGFLPSLSLLDSFTIRSNIMPNVGFLRGSVGCFSDLLNASIFADSIMYMPDPNQGRQMTYTFRLLDNQELEARISGFENGAFFKRTVILRKQ